ncbi:hypothetical protein KEM56_003990 [Ascosphaera pollenicola]|nr:hypothetical protein KEM56_003990 [Ascosphaera pollenicola]
MATSKSALGLPRLILRPPPANNPAAAKWSSRGYASPVLAGGQASPLHSVITRQKAALQSPAGSAWSAFTPLTAARYITSTAQVFSRPTVIEQHRPKRSAVAITSPVKHNGVYVALWKPARRAFHRSRSQQQDPHFDTLEIVHRLKAEGFSEEQSEALMRVLNNVIEQSIQNLKKTMVLREDAERSTYTQKVDFSKLRSELLNADSAETQVTRAAHDRIAGDLAKLNSRLRDEISRTQASVRLDLNLEKGRIREEANAQEMRIKETETRIEQEVAGLRERVEAVKFSTLQWLMWVHSYAAVLC